MAEAPARIALTYADPEGFTALHHAVVLLAPLSLISLILKTYKKVKKVTDPDLVGRQDRDGCTALHHAALRTTDVGITKSLVLSQPSLLLVRNDEGLTPVEIGRKRGGGVGEFLVKCGEAYGEEEGGGESGGGEW